MLLADFVSKMILSIASLTPSLDPLKVNRVAFSMWLAVASMCVCEVCAMLSRVCFSAPMTYPTLSVGIVRSSVTCSPDRVGLFSCGVVVVVVVCLFIRFLSVGQSSCSGSR